MMEECYVYMKKKKRPNLKQITTARNKPMLVINLETAFELLWGLYSFSLFNNQAEASPKTGGIVHTFENLSGYKQ